MKKIITGIILAAFCVTVYSEGDIRSDIEPDPAISVASGDLDQTAANKAEAMSAFAKVFLKPSFSAAVPEFLKTLERDPSSELPLIMLIAGLSDKEKCQEVYPALIDIAIKHPEALQVSILAVKYLEETGKGEQAASIAAESIETFKQRPALTEKDLKLYGKFVALLSSLYIKQKKFEAGEELFDELLEYAPFQDNFEVLCAAAIFYSIAADKSEDSSFLWFESQREKLTRKRDEQLAKLTAMAKSNQQLILLSGIYEDLGRYNDAENLLLDNLLSHPDNKVIQNELAQYFSRRHAPVALPYWRALIKKHELQPAYYLYLANAALNAHRLQEAENAFQWHLLANPKNQNTRLSLALVRQQQWKLDKALEILNSAPQTIPVLISIGSLKYLEGDYQESLKTMNRALELASKNKNVKLPMFMIVTMISLGEKAKDMELVKKYAELWRVQYPDEFAAYANTLGYILADNNLELDKARNLIDEALKESPDSAEYLDSLAWVLYRQKKYSEAAKAIEKCLAAGGRYPHAVIANHAGDIYNALSDREKALKYWQLALKIYDPTLDREKVSQKIKSLENKQ